MRKSKISNTVLFFAGTFLLTWIFWSLPLLYKLGYISNLPPWWGIGGFAPSVVGALTVLFSYGKEGIKLLFKRMIRFKSTMALYSFVVIFPLALAACTMLISTIVFNIHFDWSKLPDAYLIPILFIQILLLGGPLNEELGWRGFALPALLEWMNGLRASLIIGVMWAIWHLPLYFAEIPGYTSMPFFSYLLNVISLSVIFTHLYRKGGNQLWLCILLHAILNTTNWLLLPLMPEGKTFLITSIYALLTTLSAIFIMVIHWKDFMNKERQPFLKDDRF